MLAPSEQTTSCPLPPSAWPPNYIAVYKFRQHQRERFQKNPKYLLGAIANYSKQPIEFISHWVDTYDPRNVASGMRARVPFVLFPRQEELVEFLLSCLTAEQNGLIEKSRDLGATWICAAFSVWLWLFKDGSAVGWGSRKEQLVDRLGDADSIFEKMRMVVRGLPPEFLPAGLSPEHMTYMRFVNPTNGSTITGESGDNIGRGGRKLIYFKDESAHYEHPEMIEASLTDNTRVQIDLSSVHGLGTVFHRKREAGIDWAPGQPIVKGKTNVFVMDWRDHPLKTQAWHDEREAKARGDGLLHIFAQEVERNYAASVEGVIIPAEWVSAAIDADVKLGFDDSGMWGAALDVADEGLDTNALAKRKGVVVKSVEEWGERDTGKTTRRAVDACCNLGPISLQYDSIGVGAGVKAEANRLADDDLMPKTVFMVPWNAGAEVLNKEEFVIPGDRNSPLNGDFYGNLKAQGWWQLRLRFERTWRAKNDPTFTWEPEQLISLPSSLPLIRKIQKELSQATVSTNTRMKLIVDKSPEGTRSPNLADAIMMMFWPLKGVRPLNVSTDVLQRAMQAPRHGLMGTRRRLT